MSKPHFLRIKRVSATDFRDDLKERLAEAKDNTVLLVENRRQVAKYVVDQAFLDQLVGERQSMLATLEILADRELTNRLAELNKTDLSMARVYTMDEVFG